MSTFGKQAPKGRRKYIEIKREIDRKMGNKMVLDRVRRGEYKLRTGEADLNERRTELYADQFEDEIQDVVEDINEREDLGFDERDVKNQAKSLHRQMKEGKERMQMLTKKKREEVEDDEDEKDKKKRRLFF